MKHNNKLYSMCVSKQILKTNSKSVTNKLPLKPQSMYVTDNHGHDILEL